MRLEGSIVIMGDVHGDFGRLNKFLNRKHPAIVIQTGDFGFWPRAPITAHPKYKHGRPAPKVPAGSMLYWCDGNHEDHQELENRVTDEFWPRTKYMDRGKTLVLPDGRVVLFMGGALSIDRYHRIIGSGKYGWFQREQVRECDVMDLDVGKIDIVVSHTCPTEFDVPMRYDYYDTSRLALSYILHKYKPSRWYCGHWHDYTEGEYLGCKWTAMGRFDAPGHGGWIVLD